MNAKLRRGLARAILIVLLLASVELIAQLGYRVYKGTWYFRDRQRSARGLFQPHPYFAAAMTPGVSDERNGIRISHNSFRMRGPEFARPKPSGTRRIIANGGSTTYCTGVSDDETWEHFLQRDLGIPWEVLNNGTPGGTSVEALLQTNLLFSDVQPDLALYYMGWNDAHVQHVQGLRSDYSDYHGVWVMSLGQSGRELREPLALTYMLKRAAFHYFLPNMDGDVIIRSVQGDADRLTDRIDPRALGLFERNLRLIAASGRAQGFPVVFIPQVMNYEALTSDQPYGFLPFVRDRDLKTYMTAYNATLEKVAKEEGVGFLGEMLEEKFPMSEFLDQGHFTRAGNEHFARVVGAYLKKHPFSRAP